MKYNSHNLIISERDVESIHSLPFEYDPTPLKENEGYFYTRGMEISMKQIQDEIFDWSKRNFGYPVVIKYDISSFLGMVEEIGEISHSILKMSQGIRGTDNEHIEKIKDGIADLLIFTLDFSARNGLNAEKELNDVWNRVKNRDWTKNKLDGGESTAETSENQV